MTKTGVIVRVRGPALLVGVRRGADLARYGASTGLRSSKSAQSRLFWGCARSARVRPSRGTRSTRFLAQADPSEKRPVRSAAFYGVGVVLRDLAVMLADGGECLADIGAMRDQPDLFGNVASDSTAFRVIDSVDEQCLARLRAAVAVARARAWKLGARPQRRVEQDGPELTVLDLDATLRSSAVRRHGTGV